MFIYFIVEATMGVDISFYTLKYPKESVQKLFDYERIFI